MQANSKAELIRRRLAQEFPDGTYPRGYLTFLARELGRPLSEVSRAARQLRLKPRPNPTVLRVCYSCTQCGLKLQSGREMCPNCGRVTFTCAHCGVAVTKSAAVIESQLRAKAKRRTFWELFCSGSCGTRYWAQHREATWPVSTTG